MCTHSYLSIILCLAPFVNHPPQNLSHKYRKSGRCLLLVNQIILKTRQVLIRKNQPATVQPAPVIDEAVVNLEKRNMKNLFMTVLDNAYKEASMFTLLPEDFD